MTSGQLEHRQPGLGGQALAVHRVRLLVAEVLERRAGGLAGTGAGAVLQRGRSARARRRRSKRAKRTPFSTAAATGSPWSRRVVAASIASLTAQLLGQRDDRRCRSPPGGRPPRGCGPPGRGSAHRRPAPRCCPRSRAGPGRGRSPGSRRSPRPTTGLPSSRAIARLQIFPIVTSSGRPGAAAAKVWKALLRVRISTSGRTFSWLGEVLLGGAPRRRSRCRTGPGASSTGSSSLTRAARNRRERFCSPATSTSRAFWPAWAAAQAHGRRHRALADAALAQHEAEPPLRERWTLRRRAEVGRQAADALGFGVARSPARIQPRATALRGQRGQTTQRR